jgi:hypothetical protein
MRSNVAWVVLGLSVLACSSSKLVSDSFDTGVDAPTDGPGVVFDAGAVDAGRDVAAQGGDAASCPGATDYTVENSYRHTVAWTFVSAAADAGGAPAGDGGDGETASSPSRCVASAGAAAAYGLYDHACRGGAWLRSGASGPVVTFDDGSTLTWKPSAPPVPAPTVAQAAGDRVWVNYQQATKVICPVCGAYTNRWLEIRDTGSTGTVRHYAQEGNHLTSPLALAMAMFGATVTEEAACQVRTGPCPASFDRTEFEHQVATTPAQWIPFGVLTAINSPNGIYDVVWAATSEANIEYSATNACGSDNPAVSNDDGFAGTRRGP